MLELFSGGLQCRFDQRRGETFQLRARFGKVGLEAVDESQQLVDFGDDAPLFGQ